jgi:hypothetical protein
MASDGTGSGGALIKLGELSKPATTLIEKVSDAVGGIAKPWQIVRVAKAEAKAEVIRSHARVEISEIEERALLRMVREEGKKQENIESITAQAIPHLAPNAKPENVEDDWLSHFFDRCRLVSDSEMQSLWAKILAGEANQPTKFSKRTVDLVATLDKPDAHLFSQFCRFIWMIFGFATPIIIDATANMYKSDGINFMSLTHLDNIGLITFNHLTGFMRQNLPNPVTAFYYDRPVTIERTINVNDLQLGHVILTRAGEDLIRVCQSTPSDEYFMYVLENWSRQQHILSSPVQIQTNPTP